MQLALLPSSMTVGQIIDIGWLQQQTACHSLAVHPVQNVDKNI